MIGGQTAVKAIVRSVLMLVAWAFLLGIIVGAIEVTFPLHAPWSSLSVYQRIQLGTTWSEVRDILKHSHMDCPSFETSDAPPSILFCSDYWWNYSLRFDAQTSRVRVKRFYPGFNKPLISRLIIRLIT